MRTQLSAAVGAVALTAGALLGAPAAGAQATDYPTNSFRVEVGNTWTDGKLTWYNRSVLVEGTHKSVSSAGKAYCRLTWGRTYDASRALVGTRGSDPGDMACGTTRSFSFVVPADIVGGAQLVRICLDDGNYNDLLCAPYRRP
ncbi:hypothetical protein GKQ77_30120 [Streptomyces sp. BG9H]|uniref:Secreted protein n=1 Tax=Streptomyces anatolicus TaxID=2675858 RepID=A0ABS6YWH1_9ACTN|nr:hypothetical protein [Streptomyces anatolicus]